MTREMKIQRFIQEYQQVLLGSGMLFYIWWEAACPEPSEAKSIARKYNRDPRTIQRYLQWLRECGLAEKQIIADRHTYRPVLSLTKQRKNG